MKLSLTFLISYYELLQARYSEDDTELLNDYQYRVIDEIFEIPKIGKCIFI